MKILIITALCLNIFMGTASANETHLVERINSINSNLDEVSYKLDQQKLHFKAFRKAFQKLGIKISNVKMRTSYSFVSGGAALTGDALAKFPELRNKIFEIEENSTNKLHSLDVDSKKLTFLMKNIPYSCDVIFGDFDATEFGKRKRGIVMRVTSCENREDSLGYLVSNYLNPEISNNGRSAASKSSVANKSIYRSNNATRE